MKKILLCSLIFIFALKLSAQTDTSSFFPLGLWGIWPDETNPPRNGVTIPTPQWNKETSELARNAG